MSDSEKVLTYEEAKELCKKAFDGGMTYGETSMRYSCNAVAYDWDHWLKKNEGLFRPKPTVEDVLCEMLDKVDDDPAGEAEIIAEYAKCLLLAGDE